MCSRGQTASLCLGAAEPQSGRNEINYMNNKKPDASHQPPPHTAQRDAEGKQAAQNPRRAPK